MIFRLLIAFCSLLALCGCTNEPNSDTPSGEISIARLKSLCKGDHYRIISDCSIRGIVVATDWLGELNKSAIMVDNSGALEVAIDSRNIAKVLPLYSEVEIVCSGLMLARIGGKIELGATPTADFPLANIDDDMIGRYIRIVSTNNEYTPIVKRFSEIGIADISAVIRFDNVRICDEEQGLTWCDKVDDKPVTTYRTLVDREGNSLAVRTLSTCKYALNQMPSKEISAIGAIDYSDNRYFLRIVNEWITE